MSLIFGDEVNLMLNNVHVKHNAHQPAYRTVDKMDTLERVATDQRLLSVIERV